MKSDFEEELAKKTEDFIAAVSDIVPDAKREMSRTVQKVSSAAGRADKKVEKAGNEMKATLQQMKQNIMEFPRKAEKKNRK